jgi:tetratricopeptide (TPR) repeat protein
VYDYKLKIMKKFSLMVTFLYCFFTASSFALSQKEQEGFTYVDFYDFITTYGARTRSIVDGSYDDKRIDITGSSSITYLEKPEKYITYLEYRGSDRRINIYQQPFLLDWFKISSAVDEYRNNNTAESILADANFELFFSSTLYSTKGKSYFITTQRAISDGMAKSLKIGELIKVYILNLGYYTTDMPVFLVIGYEKSTTISKAIKNKMYLQQYFPVIRDDVFNRRYDKAKGSIELLLRKYPGNEELQLNLCLIFNQTNFFDKSIQCYKAITIENPKNYNSYYGLAMAYYDSIQGGSFSKDKISGIIDNTTNAINLIDNLTNSPKGSMAMIYYNSFYLRAMAKMQTGDQTAINDLMKVNANQPALIGSDSIDVFKKKLGLL